MEKRVVLAMVLSFVVLWLWSSFLFTTGLACVTAWGILRQWEDEDPD